MISEIRRLFTQNSLESNVILEKAIELGSDYLRGGWNLLEINEVKVTQITGGQSNLIYLASSNSNKTTYPTPSCFLIRIHCQPSNQVFNDTVIFSIMSERGLGPKLYGFFPGGRLEEYLPSRTLDTDSIKLPEISRRVGALFPKYHGISVPISKSPGAFHFIKQNLEAYKKLGGSIHKMCPYSVKYENEAALTTISVEELEHEIEVFENWSKVFDDTVVFSHNDLAPLNVLELNNTKEIIFIDFEYSSYNWRGFDLCMFLCENAFDYRVPPPGVWIDQEFIENHPNLRMFTEAYIDTLFKMKEENPDQKHPITEDRESEIERLMSEIKFFIPLVNLFWAVWSLKSFLAKHDNGHNLEVAASDRLTMYFHFKPQSEKIFEQFKNK
ncbi:CBN-CKB-4 protein [Caenorhabditis brenneri]|uniref:CBN-CKB-4 protein n=1 Tax=Caenorhabditis brenneri TaxID=135651 RepID=G0MK51_CAEBE|nr:CBN-CKB-4 protein [Caenorhabditis brenneri]